MITRDVIEILCGSCRRRAVAFSPSRELAPTRTVLLFQIQNAPPTTKGFLVSSMSQAILQLIGARIDIWIKFMVPRFSFECVDRRTDILMILNAPAARILQRWEFGYPSLAELEEIQIGYKNLWNNLSKTSTSILSNALYLTGLLV